MGWNHQPEKEPENDGGSKGWNLLFQWADF